MSVHLGAWKAGTWLIGLAGAAVYTFVEKDTTSARQLVIIACAIAAVPPTITGIFGLILQHNANKKLHDVSEKLNGVLAKAHLDQQAASARADTAEGFRAGSESERGKNGKDK